MQSRDQLRAQIRARRRALSRDEQTRRSRMIAHQLVRSRAFLNARRLAAYIPVRGEADPLPALAQARRLGKAVYLPVLAPFGEDRLWFVEWKTHVPLTRNRFGIPEPRRRRQDLLSPTQLDLVLAPLVGFDDLGNRLGMGGGFYDRSFAFLNHRTRWHRPLLIGYAYAFQEIERLQACAWDVRLDGVVTEAGLTLFGHRAPA